MDFNSVFLFLKENWEIISGSVILGYIIGVVSFSRNVLTIKKIIEELKDKKEQKENKLKAKFSAYTKNAGRKIVLKNKGHEAILLKVKLNGLDVYDCDELDITTNDKINAESPAIISILKMRNEFQKDFVLDITYQDAHTQKHKKKTGSPAANKIITPE
ncbi:hypothetical protein LCM10_18575 [Rossellomorea aquimaris]|uniref:hypothetical protein n=1 Tax=Rossellomorea aquimaris TaxID=189382 RepID=UPI001CD26649|nr:hypothetical protein [Rossellomorea aquimaris]MCA1056972.1 hypothetical protein [Rossellomorea aquimaris]